jgi:hypothetical protein
MIYFTIDGEVHRLCQEDRVATTEEVNGKLKD